MSTAKAESEATKRGPGRPRKTKKPPKLPRLGVVEAPTDPDHRIELAYDDPNVFKSVFTYFKNLKATTIYWLFSKAGLSMFTRDIHKAARVVAQFPGAAMNQYYCDSPFLISMQYSAVEYIFSSINKKMCSKITLTNCHDEPNRINVIFKDFIVESENHSRQLVTYHESVPVEEDDLFAVRNALSPEVMEQTALEFVLPKDKFKKIMVDAKRFTDIIELKKMGGEDMTIEYSKDASYRSVEVFRKPENIALVSKVPSESLCNWRLGVDTMKSLANAIVFDSVRIICPSDQRSVTLVSGEGGILVCTLVQTEA